MIRNVLVDTGPLIALLDRRDRHHDWTRSRFAEIVPPLSTCEAVLTEACFLAQRLADGVPALLGLFEQGVCELNFGLAANLSEVSNIVQRYHDLPASLADACLVRMSEATPHSVIMTLDAHFHVYRRGRRQRIPLLLPPEV